MEAFQRGVEAWRSGRYFDAHEEWEDVWRSARDPAERAALQGLIQLAASLHKEARGESAGHVKLWRKGRENLLRGVGAFPRLHGLDLEGFAAQLSERPAVASERPALPYAEEGFGVLYLHGFGSSPDGVKGRAILQGLRADGVPVVAPRLADPDEFLDFTVSRSLGRARHGLFERTLLVGSSLGGWTGTLLAREDDRVKELVLLCPAFRFSERWLKRMPSSERARWEREQALEFEVGHPPQMRPLSFGFVRDAAQHDGQVQPRVPTTVFHGSQDEVVPLEDVVCTVGRQSKVTLRVVEDDHGLSRSLPDIVAHCRARAHALGFGEGKLLP